MDIILASASPRRQQLLRELGLRFRVVVPVGITEQVDGLPPATLAMENARRKAAAVAANHPEALVIGADTIVVQGTRIFGKPGSIEEADAMLCALAGHRHDVITGVCLIHRPFDLELLFHEVTAVWMRPLTEPQRREYLALINPLDKAGAYAIQEHGDRIIERIEGSYSNVVGLPIERLKASLEKLGIPTIGR
ncbi:MAG: Maf family protein [Verrucomicrobiae bacterium]|nr:Maf family protein [Verrucomicrobiae bacterium]MDW8344861.1 Maf family protein [Verrucomicrobiae bacterium]